MSNFQPPPTWAELLLVDEKTNKATFNPIWLNWFLGLTQNVSAGGPGTVTGVTATSPLASSGGNAPIISIASSTGSGAVVLATGPTLVAPVLGTPASGVATNLTGTAAGLTAGTVTTNANLTGPIQSTGNTTSISAQTGTGTTFVMQTAPTVTRLYLSDAVGKIGGSATSINFRNVTDSADNIVIADAGAITFRSTVGGITTLTATTLAGTLSTAAQPNVTSAGASLVWGTGVANFGMVTRRKTADETVASSNVLQDDDHLLFPIAASEEWVAIYNIDVGDAINTHGVKIAVTVPSGATLNLSASLTTDSNGVTGGIRTTTSGTGVTFGLIAGLNGTLHVMVWVLNSSTAGSVTLQFCQQVASVSTIRFRKGSTLQAMRIA